MNALYYTRGSKLFLQIWTYLNLDYKKGQTTGATLALTFSTVKHCPGGNLTILITCPDIIHGVYNTIAGRIYPRKEISQMSCILVQIGIFLFFFQWRCFCEKGYIYFSITCQRSCCLQMVLFKSFGKESNCLKVWFKSQLLRWILF